jgi:hypothetical protein
LSQLFPNKKIWAKFQSISIILSGPLSIIVHKRELSLFWAENEITLFLGLTGFYLNNKYTQ